MARQIVVEITGDSKGFSKATATATEEGHKFGGAMTGIAAGLGLGVFNAAMGAISGLTSSVMDSADKFRKDQVSMAEMSNTLKNTIPGWDGNTKAIDAYVAKQAALGFGAKDVRDSIAQLSGVTHSVAEAQRDEAMAQELARSKGLDLATATDIITKAHEGNAKALKGLGIQVTTVTAHVDALKASHGKHTTEELKAAAAADKQETAMNALKAIMENTKGAAEAYANTSEGKLAAAQAKNEASWVKIGAVVDRLQSVIMPLVADAFEKVADAVEPVTKKIEAFTHSELFGPIMAGLAAVLVGISVALVASVVPALYASAIAGWAAVSPLLPLYALILAIGILIALVAYAWTHNFGDIQGKTHAVWAAIQPVFNTIKDWLEKHIPGALNVMGAVFKFVFEHIPIVWLITHLADIITFIKGMPGKISAAATGMWDGITAAFKAAINWLIDKWNGLRFGVPAFDFAGQHFDGVTLNVPQIPRFHQGGTMPYTGLAMLEKGEHITPAGRGGPVELHIHIDSGAFIDGHGIDLLANLILQRVRYAPGT